MNTDIRNQVYSACHLAGTINGPGIIPEDYKNMDSYKNAKFTGEVFPFAGGNQYINAGLIGEAQAGIIIAFRGTEGIVDWKNNFAASQVVSPYSCGMVHKGFLGSIQSIEQPILKKLDEQLCQHPMKDIYITGHSKGGALATLMGMSAIKEKSSLRERIQVVSFGSPRVGDEVFCSGYNLKHYRYESFLDLVPHLPFSKQEHILINRSSTFFEKYDWANTYLKLQQYKHVGMRRVYKQDDNKTNKYLHLPLESDNDQHETLNSFASALLTVFAASPLPSVEFVNYVHCHDYDKMPENL